MLQKEISKITFYIVVYSMVSCRIMNFNDIRLQDIIQDVSVSQDPLVYSFRIYFFPAGIPFILIGYAAILHDLYSYSYIYSYRNFCVFL